MAPLKAIRVAHNGKNAPINVRQLSGNVFYWNQDEDSGWLQYKRSREVIYQYRWLNWFLELIRYI